MATTVALTSNLTLQDAAATAGSSLVPSTPNLTGNGLDENYNLDSTTTPAVTMNAAGTVTLSAGSATLDLTSMTGLDGAARNGSGLKVVALKIKNNSTHSITIVKGASNGFTGFGSSFSMLIPPGATRLFFESVNGTAVSGSVKTLDFSGTGTDTLLYEASLGA